MKKGNLKNKDKSNVDELKNQLARALADYDNLRKRVEREKEELEKLANLRLVLRLLSIFDMLKVAQKHLQDSGLAISLKEFEDVLKAEGVEEIKVNVGDEFNENIEEAVELEGEEKGKRAKVKEILLSGWKLGDGTVIRHAKVKVVKE